MPEFPKLTFLGADWTDGWPVTRLPPAVKTPGFSDPPPFPTFPASLPGGVPALPSKDPPVVPDITKGIPQPLDVPEVLRPQPHVRVRLHTGDPYYWVNKIG